MVTLEQAAEYLRAAQDVLVLSHQYPDGDTLGSAFALVRTLQRMGKRARFACSHAIGKPYRFLEETVESSRLSRNASSRSTWPRRPCSASRCARGGGTGSI